MAFVLKEGQGTLFKNDRKNKDTHPDYTGSIKLPDGTECWFSAWIKTGSQGGKFMSVQIGDPKGGKPAERQPPVGVNPPMGNAPRGSMKDHARNMDDEIPF